VKRLLREPLLHFLLLGAALFVVSAYFKGDSGGGTSKQIVLSLDELKQLETYFEAQWRRPPTAQEFDAMVENRVQEEVLYREALALGLDKDDTIVRRRMAQKMRFLAEDVAAAHEPSPAELATWFDAHKDKFALPSRIAFREVYFSPDRHGANARGDAVKAMAELKDQPIDTPLATKLGDPFMLQDYYSDRTSEQLGKDFGPPFATALFELPPGSWQGPIESGFGWHLVFVEWITPGRIPALEEVEPDVKTAWLADQKQRAWNKAYDAMRAKYTVMMQAPPDTPAPSSTTATTATSMPAGAGL
jgi:peptidyl-prolyl cis-trans isomerase C